MVHSIENDLFICTIASNGAEIRSLRNKKTGKEYIWQIDPSVWGSSSPVLFPAIGNIKGGKVSHAGRDYAMPKHGIIRNNDILEFEQISSHKCSFRLASSEQTKRQYPYDFVFRVVYELIHNRLVMRYEIENTGQEVMHFACGGHTAYALVMDAFTALSDYVIEFPDQDVLIADTLGSSGYLSDKKRTFPLIKNALPITADTFLEDALIFARIDFNWVRLRKKDERQGVVVRFSGYPNLALWSKPGADYICIEPWLGLPDREDESIEISKKSTYQKLNLSEFFSISIETEIE